MSVRLACATTLKSSTIDLGSDCLPCSRCSIMDKTTCPKSWCLSSTAISNLQYHKSDNYFNFNCKEAKHERYLHKLHFRTEIIYIYKQILSVFIENELSQFIHYCEYKA